MANLDAVCHYCGEPMSASVGIQPKKYCGQNCRKAASRARQKSGAQPDLRVLPVLPATDNGTWRLSGKPPVEQLETHMERIDRLLDDAPVIAAPMLAKTWLDGFKILRELAPEKVKEGDPLDQLAAARAAKFRS
ncbi:MAG: hypothetical protein FWG25_05600 [Promicromonosporaceae bacterium]|nr:hypothetical protein [Promicromonosporaceae bacterium]